LNKYEVMFILMAEQTDEAIAAQIEKFQKIVADNSGTVTETKLWGKRRLAYPIQYKNEGYYVLMYMETDPSFPVELERNFKNDEQVLRFMIVRIEE